MNDFSLQIRQFSSRLPLPEPTRSRVLLEMAADMEDLFQHYLDQGLEKDQALQAVEEHFDLSDEALRELIQVHTSPLQRSLDGLSGQIRSPWERGALALVALVVMLGLVRHLFHLPLYQAASPLAFILLAILALSTGLGIRRGMVLFGPGSRKTGTSSHRRGSGSLPLLALLLLGTGFGGVWVELYRTALEVRADTEYALKYLVEWLHMTCATLVVALSGALLVGLLWFFLETRASQLDERAASSMMEDLS